MSPEEVDAYLSSVGTTPLRQKRPVREVLLRPEVSLGGLVAAAGPSVPAFDADALNTVEMDTKYAGYVARERQRAEQLVEREEVRLPPDLDYQSMNALSFEARQKLTAIRPATLGQAGRIPGVSPSDLQNLLVALKVGVEGGTTG